MICVRTKTTRGLRNTTDHTTNNMGKAKYCLSTKYHLFCVPKEVEPCGECLCFYYHNTYTPRTEVTEALETCVCYEHQKTPQGDDSDTTDCKCVFFFHLLTSVLVIYNSWVPLRFSGLDTSISILHSIWLQSVEYFVLPSAGYWQWICVFRMASL